MTRILGVFAVVISLSACTAAQQKEMEESNKIQEKADNYCKFTMGYKNDPKTLMACKQHYVQGAMDAQKSQ